METCRQMQNAIHQNTVTRNSVPRIDPTMIPVSPSDPAWDSFNFNNVEIEFLKYTFLHMKALSGP